MATTRKDEDSSQDLPPVTEYPDEGEALRRRQGMGIAQPAQKAAAEAGAANELSDILSRVSYPADRNSILAFLGRVESLPAT